MKRAYMSCGFSHYTARSDILYVSGHKVKVVVVNHLMQQLAIIVREGVLILLPCLFSTVLPGRISLSMSKDRHTPWEKLLSDL